MAAELKNAADVVKAGLCTGCGVCTNACKTGAISMELGWDGYRPVVDAERCVSEKGCRRCLNSCPGHAFEIEKYQETLQPGCADAEGLGRAAGFYTGYSLDDEIRYHSASGGMVTGLLLYLLETGRIAGAVVAGFSKELPYRSEAIAARTRDEILAARSSKYCPVSYGDVYDAIMAVEGKVVIVGLPCHVQGFRMLAAQDTAFAAKVFGYFGLFCSSTRTALLPEYLCYKYGIEPAAVKSFAFRDEGYPGYLKIEAEDGRRCRVHYHDYYRKVRAFFNPRRCMVCFDQTAEFADVSFGDIHLPEYMEDDKGVNSVIVRNREFLEILKQAREAGYVQFTPVVKEKVMQAQKAMIYTKTKRIHAALFLRKLLGLRNPDYGPGFKGAVRLKDMVSVAAGYLQTVVGRRRFLWPVIGGLEFLIRKMKPASGGGAS